MQYNSQYSVQYSVSYNLQGAGNRLNLKEFASSARHFDVWLQCIIQYSVQCTVECTLYCSAQYRYVGYSGTQWDLTITKVIRKKSFWLLLVKITCSPFCGKREANILNFDMPGWRGKFLSK